METRTERSQEFIFKSRPDFIGVVSLASRLSQGSRSIFPKKSTRPIPSFFRPKGWIPGRCRILGPICTTAVKLDHFRGKNKKCLKPPPNVYIITMMKVWVITGHWTLFQALSTPISLSRISAINSKPWSNKRLQHHGNLRVHPPLIPLMVQKSQTTTWDGAETLWIMGFQLPFPQLVIAWFQPSTYRKSPAFVALGG